MTLLPRLGRLLRFILQKVILEPIREGRLTDTGWPGWLRGTVVVGSFLYLLGALSTLLAPWLRSRFPMLVLAPDLTAPWPLVALTLLLITFALSTLYGAALRLRMWWLQAAIWLVITASLLKPLGLGQDPIADWHWTVWVTVPIPLLLGIVLFWQSLRSGSGGWGFWVGMLLIGHGVVLPIVFQPEPFAGAGIDLQLARVMDPLSILWPLSIPGLALAGAAATELMVSLASWTVTGVWQQFTSTSLMDPTLRAARHRRGLRWGMLALAALFALRFGLFGWQAAVDHELGLQPLPALISSLLVLALAVPIGLAGWFADRVAGDLDIRPDPDDVPRIWRGVSPWMGLGFGFAAGAGLLVGGIVEAFGFQELGSTLVSLGGTWRSIVLLAVLAVAFGVAGYRTARRGLRVTAMCLAAFGALAASTVLMQLTGSSIMDSGLLLAPTLIALGLTIWLAVRRRLDTGRLAALCMVMLLMVGYDFRQWFDEPLTQLISLTSIPATLLVGLLWRLFTDSGWSRHGSRRFPIDARVLLALANAFFALTLATLFATFGGHFILRLDDAETAGDGAIGRSLVLVSSFIALSLAWVGSERNFTRGESQLH